MAVWMAVWMAFFWMMDSDGGWVLRVMNARELVRRDTEVG